MCDQGWALCVKMFMPGSSQLGSSMLPAMIATSPGMLDDLPNSREPHSVQKPRRDVPPLSVALSWYLTGPVISIVASGTAKAVMKPPPLAFWQLRQWQWPGIIGSAPHS
jgi:hypothetical protein